VCAWRAATASPESSVSWSVHGNTSAFPLLEGALRLHVAGCDLAWRAPAARACLRRLGHVVVVGDSVSRLAYVTSWPTAARAPPIPRPTRPAPITPTF
jgi:hypothetical protein